MVDKKVIEETKICDICGKTISGDYEYIKTKGQTELFFCKKCIRNMKEVTHEKG